MMALCWGIKSLDLLQLVKCKCKIIRESYSCMLPGKSLGLLVFARGPCKYGTAVASVRLIHAEC